MQQMRDLAHDGRTIIVVTHSVANLQTCDRLLVLVPGGRIAYYGPPDEASATSACPTGRTCSRRSRPIRTVTGRPSGCVAVVHAISADGRARRGGQRSRACGHAAAQRRGGLRQMTTLTRRYVGDRVHGGYLTFMVLLPIILGALIRLIPTSPDGLAGPPGKNNGIATLLLILVICACLSGTASSIRELVKERPIYIRERAAGLPPGAYLFSKLLVLGVISIVAVLPARAARGGRAEPDAPPRRLPDPRPAH